MSAALDGLLLALLALELLPVTLLLAEVLCASLPRQSEPLRDVVRPRLAVLVPAHDESTGMLGTLRSVLPQLVAGDRLVVVADNCSDDTAQVAALAGAEVLVRRDASRIGKGYALDFGLQHLARDSPGPEPGVVIVIDADCLVTPGTLDRISRLSASTGKPVQAMYLMKAPASAGVMGSIAEFAWIVKNKVRPLGTHYLGLPCHMMGTGMALPWTAMRSVKLASGHIVEDLAMGVDFARAGLPALYCPEALVTSEFPASQEGARTQRTRWEHGHLSMLIEEAPRLFLDGATRLDAGLLLLALDICVPPLALLALAILALSVLCVLDALLTASFLPLIVSGIVALMFAMTIGLSWWRFGREAVTFSGLLQVFWYVLRKVPLYLRFLVRRQRKWVRSKRDAD